MFSRRPHPQRPELKTDAGRFRHDRAPIHRAMSVEAPKRPPPARVRNRRRVMRAAHALVTKDGLEALTMRRLAVEADVSVATLTSASTANRRMVSASSPSFVTNACAARMTRCRLRTLAGGCRLGASTLIARCIGALSWRNLPASVFNSGRCGCGRLENMDIEY